MLLPLSSHCCSSHTRQSPSDYGIEDYPQPPHIHGGAILGLGQEEFWGGIGGAAIGRAQLMTSEVIAEAKVCNSYVHLRTKDLAF